MFQPALDEIMIVAIPSVNRYGSFVSLRRDCERVVLGCVGKANNDHAPGFGPERLWMTSLFGSRSQPSHIAVIACLDEVGQPQPGFMTQGRLTKSDRVKTYPQRIIPDLVSRISLVTATCHTAMCWRRRDHGQIPLRMAIP